MATQTLAEAAKLINDDLVAGIAEDIITVNPFFDVFPFDSFIGQSVTVNRESVLGDSDFYSVGDTIIAKNASQNTPVTFYPTKIIGDAEVDGLVAATSGSAGVDQMAVEVSSKAKSVARKFQTGLATGNGTLPQMNGMGILNDVSQNIAHTPAGVTTTGAELVSAMYAMLDLVTAKDGEVDFVVANSAVLRLYREYRMSLGGANVDAVELSSGRKVMSFDGIPFFKNDYLAANSVYAGCFDDGTRKIGLAGIAPENNMGISAQAIGAKETADEQIVRVKWYANSALFNRRGLSNVTGIVL